MALEPLYDKVVVKPVEQEKMTSGGIVIPDTAKEKPMKGKITAVGCGTRAENGKVTPPLVKVGDMIIFGKYAGNNVKIDGVEYIIMKESEILGKFE